MPAYHASLPPKEVGKYTAGVPRQAADRTPRRRRSLTQADRARPHADGLEPARAVPLHPDRQDRHGLFQVVQEGQHGDQALATYERQVTDSTSAPRLSSLDGLLDDVFDRIPEVTPSAPSRFSNMSVVVSSSELCLSSHIGESLAATAPTCDPVSATSAATMPSATAYPATQVMAKMPQSYGFHNLNVQSVIRADGTKHSYFTLPTDYPLERDVPEPVFAVDDEVLDGYSNESVRVFTDTPELQTYEEDKQASDKLLKCVSKATDHEQTSACLNTTSDVQVFSLELQQQADERAYSCSDLKASDSVVTRSNQLNIEHSIRGLRLLWDPGDIVGVLHASIQEKTNNHLTKCNSLKYLLQSADIKYPPILSYFSILRYCSVKCNSWLNAVLLCMCDHVEVLYTLSLIKPWDPGASAFLMTPLDDGSSNDPIGNEHVGHLVSSLGELSFHNIPPAKPPESEEFPAMQAIQSTCFLLEAIQSWQRGAFSLGNFSRSALWLNLTLAGDKIFEDQHSLDSSMKKGTIFSSGRMLPWNPRYAILLLHYFLWEFSMDRMLSKSAVLNRMDLKHFCTELSLQFHSWCTILDVFLRVQYYCLPIVLDCLELVQPFACYSRMFSLFSLTEAILSVLCMSSATTVRAIVVLCSGKIAPGGRDTAALYQVLQIQLPISNTSHIWDPGIESLLFPCNWLNITELIQIKGSTSMTYNGIFLSEYPYILIFLHEQWEFLHQQGVQKSYNAKNLLAPQKYPQICEMDIIFITFLPP